jgi:hypothetical protein
MAASEELARPYKREAGYDTLEMTAGLALFHSGFLKPVVEAAFENNIDPRRLILALCKHSLTTAPPDLIAQAVNEVLATRA